MFSGVHLVFFSQFVFFCYFFQVLYFFPVFSSFKWFSGGFVCFVLFLKVLVVFWWTCLVVFVQGFSGFWCLF